MTDRGTPVAPERQVAGTPSTAQSATGWLTLDRVRSTSAPTAPERDRTVHVLTPGPSRAELPLTVNQ